MGKEQLMKDSSIKTVYLHHLPYRLFFRFGAIWLSFFIGGLPFDPSGFGVGGGWSLCLK
jgi:hypothetical protein